MKQRGFTIIELMTCIVILAILAALSVPKLMRIKMQANEASAVASLRTFDEASKIYFQTYGIGFPANPSNLAPSLAASSSAADLLDNVLVTGTKSGYGFSYTSSSPVGGFIYSFTITGVPMSVYTGQRRFFTDESFVIRQNWNANATVASVPVN